MQKPKLETTSKDIVAAAARGVAAACPIIGGLISEAVNQIIPNQKLDRVIDYLQILDGEVSRLKGDFVHVEKHLKDNYGLDLFEESLVQASRAISKERRKRIANIMARSLSREELKYAESKKMMNLLRELTDPELILVMLHSRIVYTGSKYHRQFIEKYPGLLEPGAVNESYYDTLFRLNLLETGDRRIRGVKLTPLGSLLLSYIGNIDENAEEKSEPHV